jgi:hypothetical protein
MEVLQNVGILKRHYMVSQPRIPQLEPSSLRKPRILLEGNKKIVLSSHKWCPCVSYTSGCHSAIGLHIIWKYKVCPWSFWNDFIISICVYLQITEGVTFEVLPLSSCALSLTMLPLLETFLELLLWNSFQCCHHIFFEGGGGSSSVSGNLHPLKADYF